MLDSGNAWAAMTAVHNLFQTESDEVRLSFSGSTDPTEWPEWYRRLLTKMLVLLSGDTVVYASANLADSEDVPSGSAVVFTPKRVILGEVAGMSGAATVTTWTRRHIKSVAIDNLPPYPVASAQDEVWPIRLRSEVVFDQGFSLYLPLNPTASTEHLGSTIALLQELVRELK